MCSYFTDEKLGRRRANWEWELGLHQEMQLRIWGKPKLGRSRPPLLGSANISLKIQPRLFAKYLHYPKYCRSHHISSQIFVSTIVYIVINKMYFNYWQESLTIIIRFSNFENRSNAGEYLPPQHRSAHPLLSRFIYKIYLDQVEGCAM